MKITYLYNSGFALSWPDHLVIIDYCKDTPGKGLADGVIRPEDLCGYKYVTVLASHGHSDHFNPCILEWAKQRRIRYVFGYDIAQKKLKAEATYLRPGQSVSLGDLDITAYGSTDEGVSFHLRKKDISIFHAGDLNNWHWQEESTPQEIAEAGAWFQRELDVIRLHALPLDITFFPIDPRMKTDIYRGALQFAEATHTTRLIPMHFGSQLPLTRKFLNAISPYSWLTCIINPGDTIEVK